MAEQVILLQCKRDVPIETIHQSTALAIRLLGSKISDIVPAYHSITLFTALPLSEVADILEGAQSTSATDDNQYKVRHIPICYEMGQDIERLSKHTGFPTSELIKRHQAATYRVVFVGFTPGFIYSDGLDTALACPRLENPRKKVAAGSIGIADGQTGVYSLESPGGWNIIGQTPLQLFDKRKKPPLKLTLGAMYQFYSITLDEFRTWED